MVYIQVGFDLLCEECFFCEVLKFFDVEWLIVVCGEMVYVLFNLFLYNFGYLLVCFYCYIVMYDQVILEEVVEIGVFMQIVMWVLSEVLYCDGFNFGMNQGVVVGVGVDVYLYQYVVLWWCLDVNFFLIIVKMKVFLQFFGEVCEVVFVVWFVFDC